MRHFLPCALLCLLNFCLYVPFQIFSRFVRCSCGLSRVGLGAGLVRGFGGGGVRVGVYGGKRRSEIPVKESRFESLTKSG